MAIWGSFWTLRTTKNHLWEKIWGGALGNRALGYPKGVPWDQNLGSKNFLIRSYNDAILCVLLICYAKI